jgi:hypothetical protein
MTASRTSVAKPTVPEFASREEEGEFWDTHDLTDYFDFEDRVDLEVAGPLSEPVTLHVDMETAEEVKAIAKEQGVPWDGLLYLWIIERRDAERERRATASRTTTNEPTGE